MRRCLIAVALLTVCLQTWGAWYNASWSHRASVTINAASVDEAVDWIYVPFSSFDSTWWTNVNSTDGRDIRVTQDDGTTELARYILPSFTDSGTTGTGGMFVNVDGYISASTNKDIYVYVGNGSATEPAVGATYGRNNTFDANTVAVYLPGETTTDLTGGGADLTAVGTPGTATGIEGITAADYNGSSDGHYAAVGVIAAWPATMEVYANHDTATSNGVAFGFAEDGTQYNQGGVYFKGGSAGDPVQAYFRGSGNFSTADYSGFSSSTWHLATAVRTAEAGTTYSYLDDNTPAANTATVGAITTVDYISIAYQNYGGSNTNFFDGKIAIAVAHDAVRSANYVSTRYNNFSAPGTFLTHGSSEAVPASGTTDWVEFASAATTAGGGTVDWTNASNALTDLVSAATVDLGADVTSYTLQLTNASAGLSAVSGTVNGIEIRVEATGEDDGTKELEDVTVQLIIGGSQTGDNKAVVGGWTDSTIETRDYGGTSDNWSTSATDTQVKATNFGVALQFINNGTVDALMSVYRVRVRVTYGAATADTSGFFGLLN